MLFRPNIPAELDVLDSPSLEFGQSPLASAMFGRMPGSALAERIFNDPSAWETSGELGCDESEDEEEGVEISFDANGLDKSEVETARMDSSTTPTDSKARLLASPISQQQRPPMGIQKHKVRPISLASLFQHGSEEAFLSNVQSNLHKFEGGIERTPATSDIFSPMTDSTGTPGTANTDMTMFSPSPLYSASTTLSFLDLYLDSPKLNMRKSLYAKRQSQLMGKPTTPALVIPSQPVPRRQSTLVTPLSAHPDMSVEPLKRGGSVPPLDQLSINLPPPRAQQQQTVDPIQRPQPSKLPSPPTLKSVRPPEPKSSLLPPGLGQATVQATTPKKVMNNENVVKSATTPPRSLPRPVLQQSQTEQPRRPSTSLPKPPPYSRTPSPPRDTSDPSRPSSSASVRRLPTIPLKSAAFTPLSSTTHSPALSTGRTLLGAPSPLPSSLPSSVMSPEPTPGGQTIVFQSSRLSNTVRSPPLGGPMGPRSKSDRNSRHTPSPTAKRVISGGTGQALRRPPGLML